MRAPSRSGSHYYNYKGFFSIVLFALVDADYKFIWADIGGKGSASDAQIYNASSLKEHIETGTAGFPSDAPLPGDNRDVPYFIIGDEAFALCPTLMKPYHRRNMAREERIFKYRLSRARRVVENAFGIMSNRFQIFLTKMRHNPETVKLITKTCMVLHNIMRVRYPTAHSHVLDQAEGEDKEFRPGQWRQDFNMADTDPHGYQGGNYTTRAGKAQRALLTHWVNSDVGSVTWQDRIVFKEEQYAEGEAGKDGDDDKDGGDGKDGDAGDMEVGEHLQS